MGIKKCFFLIRYIYSEFVHTSDLESVNSLLLKYCTKKISYGWLGMLVRSALAAMDFNANIQRKAKLDIDGEPRHKMKVDRTGTKVIMVLQKEKKDYSFLTNIFDLWLDCLEKGVIPAPDYPIDQEALRKRKHGFDKDDLIRKHRSRMMKYGAGARRMKILSDFSI